MTNELAKNNTAIASQNNAFDIPTGFICTCDIETEEGKKQVMNAYADSESLANHVGEVLKVCDCMTTPGIRKGRNGQNDTECQNTYFIDVDGKSYFSQSDGVARALQMIATLYPKFGKDTEKGYIEIACKENSLPNGNTIKTLVVL